MNTGLFEPFGLPLFQPQSGMDTSAITALFDGVRPLVDINPNGGFSASQVTTIVVLNESVFTDNSLNQVYAVGDGKYHFRDNFIEYNMELRVQKQWLELLGRDVPTPLFFRYGPVSPIESFIDGRRYDKGDRLGTLLSASNAPLFQIEVIGKSGYYINLLSLLYFIRNSEQVKFLRLPKQHDIPLLPASYGSDYVLELARPLNTKDELYISLAGGSKNLKIYNPDSYPDAYVSFLSHDSLHITLEGSQPFSQPKIVVEDLSDEMYKTKELNGRLETVEAHKVFVPQDDLKPFHSPYKKGVAPNGHGKREPGAGLRYMIGAIDGTKVALPVFIQQDEVDIIRQEYLFHSKPLQTSPNAVELHVPNRRSFERVVSDQKQGKLEQLQNKSNYREVLLNPTESLRIVNLLEHYYSQEMEQRSDPQMTYAHPGFTVWEISIRSAWRNPERNEAVSGVINSNHQFGKAIDIKPRSLSGGLRQVPQIFDDPPDDADDRSFLLSALFSAVRRFFKELIELNPAEKCQKVEIILENWSTTLLSYKLENGAVKLVKSSVYHDHIAVPGISTEEEIAAASRFATHVHIGWVASVKEANSSKYVADYAYRLILP